MAPMLYGDGTLNGTQQIGAHQNGTYVNHANGANGHTTKANDAFEPVAICGMACRLPGGIKSPADLWDLLVAGGDGGSLIPPSRFNREGHYSAEKRPGISSTQRGYFLDESIDLAGVDTSFTSMSRGDLEVLDPQQRMLMEVSRDALHDAGATGWAGSDTGVYIGSHGEDWHDMLRREELLAHLSTLSGSAALAGSQDYMVSARVSHELDLQGPNMTIRTACSSSMVALNEACGAIGKGDCEAAIVAGSNLILAPSLFHALASQGVLSPDGSSRSLSADANGYARAEGVVAIYIKSLSAALRDGNPIRSVVVGCAANSDGHTHPASVPSAAAQAKLIRRAYAVAGLDPSRTGMFEAHTTGTATGDPIECQAIGEVFGHVGVYVGTVKPNLGHSEATSGLTAVLKATLALEHRTIPPNIKYAPLNPRIPFKRYQLRIPTEPTPWPQDRDERVSINSFGIGGSNAHTILESATRHLPTPSSSLDESDINVPSLSRDAPQLLLFSANTPPALKDMCRNYQTLLESDSPTHAVADVAYTLANGREHLPLRSFAVASSSKFEQGAPPLTSSKKGAPRDPNIVMVFTGQGAAWPQMGRDLIRSNPVFGHTIELLGGYLKALGADWSLKEELLKPARTSRVNEAEFSQPLCTALQVALVDTLAEVGIRPQAVVGHSSGEIAGAYAAGALTAEEAIAVAFHRGAATKGRTERGGMAAVGLGWEAVQPYLLPGVITACDNSPSSVTLSGDADELACVVANIKQEQPDVLMTMLKVEKAYHSHHMLALGEAYHQAMVEAKVVGRHPSIPVYSSVTGQLLGDGKASLLGPKYWQSNLERPVLFKSAVRTIIDSPAIKNPIFLELGPHSALAGPLRQNLTIASSNAPYVATLVRRQNGSENLLHAIGKLYTLHVPLNFKALVSTPASLVGGLPLYPWDRSQRFYFESRVTKAWLNRQYAHHPLLGSKVAASTDLEHLWRNLLTPQAAPWIPHHRLSGTIVFPLAGFAAIAAEAARRVSGIDDGFSLRNLMIHNALVLDPNSHVEIITSLRRERLTDTSTSTWWEFFITSYNGHVWTKHATGDVRAETFDIQSNHTEDLQKLPRKVNTDHWYEAVRRAGLDYGPSFNTMEDITVVPTSITGTTRLRTNRVGDEIYYHQHPVILDTFFQILSCAVDKGIGRDYQRLVAAKIEHITVFRSSEDELQMSVTGEPSSQGYVGDGWVSAGSKKIMTVARAHGHIFTEAKIDGESESSITARAEWVPHIDFKDQSSLIREPIDQETYLPLLDELAKLAIHHASTVASTISTATPHLAKYKDWLMQQTPSDLERSSDTSFLVQSIEDLVKQLETTPAAPAASAISTVLGSIESILTGQTVIEDIDFVSFLEEHDDNDFYTTLAKTKPNLSVLEIGAGSGNKTSRMLKCMTRTDGQPLYSQFVVTDPSSAKVNAIKESCRGAINTRFAALDVGNTLVEQGFEEGQFDLIIATNTISWTENAHDSLSNIRRLLRPKGRFLLQEPRPGLPWAKFVLGTSPRWWSHTEDPNRTTEPFLNEESWVKTLTAAGFSDVQHVQSGFKDSMNNVIISRSHSPKLPNKRVTLLTSSDFTPDEHVVSIELEAQGYAIDHRSLGQNLPQGQDVVALLEEEQPFFADLDAARMDLFKALLRSLGNDGLLWVTRLSNVGCTDPRYAQVIGLARTLRSEMAIDFAVLETDKIVSSEGARAVVDVLGKFQVREDDAGLGPDQEYVIHLNETLVHRVFPFSLEKELLVSREADDASLTQAQPGRLNTLTWSTVSPAPLKNDEVEIEIYASGLNFRDVLVGMQIIPKRDPTFGYEASGVVRRVGPNAKEFAVGDRVVAKAFNLLSTVTILPEVHIVRMPDQISFVEGASIPVVFVTAVYGLRDIGRLSKGQSVLIHSGAGGVGLAAIQVARMLGAEVFTTVGSEKKVQYLMDTFGLPRNRIFNSRDDSFVEDILRQTDGKGVDVVLNSLAGELLHATWKCVAPWGTMVEIGKRDLLGNARLDMSPFLANRSYCCFDLDLTRAERPEILKNVLTFVMDCFSNQVLKPIRLDEIFPASRAQDAFRYMQQGKHIGKVIIEIRNPSGKLLIENIDATKKIGAELDSAGSYLLVGGLGGLGRSMSVWMAQRGARHFTYLSRSAGSSVQDAEFVVELESMGCTVQLVRGDVTNPTDVARAVGGTVAPLRGVIQMSMVLRDQMFDNMNIKDWNAVTRPKIQGTWNLHNATIANSAKLDFFLLFSSLSGVVGQVGQGNYASANTFLDAFVQYRANQNLPCTAIDLGAVEGIGYLAEHQDLLKKMQGTGWSPVQETELLDALPLAFMSPATREKRSQNASTGDSFMLGLAPKVSLSSPGSSSRAKRDPRIAVYHNMSSETVKIAGSGEDTLSAFLASVKKDPSVLKSDDTVKLFGLEVGKKLCGLLLADASDLELSSNMMDIGLDSLVAVEIRGWWKLTFGFDISTMDMLSLGTLEAVGQRITAELITKYNV